MAEGVRRKPRGYPLEVFSPQTKDPKYKCTCCQFVLRSPVQSYCGHRYCQECIATLIRDNNSEPVMCRACEAEATENEHSLIKLDQTYPDNAIKREMARLASKCPNEPCTWTGQFKDYANHEPSCSFKKEECSDCGESVRVMAVHKASECPARKVSCPHCKKTFAARSMIMHNNMCPQMPVECSYCEKRGLTRGKMREHADPQKGDCTVPRRPCPVGCNELVPMEGVNEHLNQGVPAHLMTLSNRVNVLAEQVKPAGAAASAPPRGASIGGATVGEAAVGIEIRRDINSLKDFQTDIQRRIEGIESLSAGSGASLGAVGEATANNDDVTTRLGIAEQKVAKYDQVVVVLKRELERCARQLEGYERGQRSDRARLEELDKKAQTLERQMGLKEVALNDHALKLQSLSLASYNGTLLWRIDNFSNRRHDAISGRVTSFYSPTFYTGRTGYKMSARIYLNGDGMGKGTHISIFFVLMRGEYDALLQWPFRQKVTMMMLDHNNKEHIVDAFRPDPTSSSFKKPTGDMNIASGCPLFMPLTALDNPNHRYVIDNSVFVKIIIDMTGLDH